MLVSNSSRLKRCSISSLVVPIVTKLIIQAASPVGESSSPYARVCGFVDWIRLKAPSVKNQPWMMSFVTMGTTSEEIEQRFSRDELLTNITIYWVTETISSSVRRYALDARSAAPWQRSEIPAGVAHCPQDAPLPREW